MAIAFNEYTLLSYIFSKRNVDAISSREYNIFTNQLTRLLNEKQYKNSEFKYCYIDTDYNNRDNYVRDGSRKVFYYSITTYNIYRMDEYILSYKDIESKYDEAYNSNVVSDCLNKALILSQLKDRG